MQNKLMSFNLQSLYSFASRWLFSPHHKDIRILIGASDMAFPRMNNISFWFLPPSVLSKSLKRLFFLVERYLLPLNFLFNLNSSECGAVVVGIMLIVSLFGFFSATKTDTKTFSFSNKKEVFEISVEDKEWLKNYVLKDDEGIIKNCKLKLTELTEKVTEDNCFIWDFLNNICSFLSSYSFEIFTLLGSLVLVILFLYFFNTPPGNGPDVNISDYGFPDTVDFPLVDSVSLVDSLAGKPASSELIEWTTFFDSLLFSLFDLSFQITSTLFRLRDAFVEIGVETVKTFMIFYDRICTVLGDQLKTAFDHLEPGAIAIMWEDINEVCTEKLSDLLKKFSDPANLYFDPLDYPSIVENVNTLAKEMLDKLSFCITDLPKDEQALIDLAIKSHDVLSEYVKLLFAIS